MSGDTAGEITTKYGTFQLDELNDKLKTQQITFLFCELFGIPPRPLSYQMQM